MERRLHRLLLEPLRRPAPVVGALTEPHAVRRLLTTLGLAPEPPPGRAPTLAVP